MNNWEITLKVITLTACSIIPRIPAKIIMISKDHHSAQSMMVDGIESFRYAPHPVKDSRVGQKMHLLILFIKRVFTVIMTSMVKYVIVVA